MSERVAVVGLGRLGATLVELLRRASTPCRGYDRQGATYLAPEGRGAPTIVGEGSLAEAIEGATLIVVAVPLPSLAEALAALRPLLSPAQLVVDVCSVRAAADPILAEALGPLPFVGTHPLFGPACLEPGAVPLRAVICPRPDRRAEAARAAAFYAGIGCRTVEMDAEAHDRLMAGTQALAALLGAGLRELGLDHPSEWAPPSTAALAQLAQSQNAAPGHLRELLLFGNPYAAEARARLFDALAGAARPPVGEDDPRQALLALRAQIDEVDRGLIDLFARRAEIARDISRHKATLGRPVRDPEREAAAFADRRRWAEDRAVAPDFVEQIFESILHWSRALQEDAR